jgi:hypothetical protein
VKKILENNLREEFLKAYRIAQIEHKFKSDIFIRMLNEHGAYETARRLTSTSQWQKGYEKLASLGRYDLTVEYIILQDKYINHFSEKEIFNAKLKIETAKQIKGHKY